MRVTEYRKYVVSLDSVFFSYIINGCPQSQLFKND